MKAQMFNWRGWVAETDARKLKEHYFNALLESGFKVIGEVEHYFEPQGYTVLFLLAESHFAIHTFPECQRTYLELSSCVERQFRKFVANYTGKENEERPEQEQDS